jgi:hypothetical protein
MPRNRNCFDQYKKKTNAAKVYLHDIFEQRDVTAAYTEVAELNLKVDKPGAQVFLAVFNHGMWRTVAASRSDADGGVRFPDVGCKDILYVLTYNRSGFRTRSVELASGPFILELESKAVRWLANTETVTVPEEDEGAVSFDLQKKRTGGKIEAGGSYRLLGWGGGKWHPVVQGTANDQGVLTLRGKPGRLYWLVRSEGRPVGRPFEVKKGEAPGKGKAIRY